MYLTDILSWMYSVMEVLVFNYVQQGVEIYSVSYCCSHRHLLTSLDARPSLPPGTCIADISSSSDVSILRWRGTSELDYLLTCRDSPSVTYGRILIVVHLCQSWLN